MTLSDSLITLSPCLSRLSLTLITVDGPVSGYYHPGPCTMALLMAIMAEVVAEVFEGWRRRSKGGRRVFEWCSEVFEHAAHWIMDYAGLWTGLARLRMGCFKGFEVSAEASIPPILIPLSPQYHNVGTRNMDMVRCRMSTAQPVYRTQPAMLAPEAPEVAHYRRVRSDSSDYERLWCPLYHPTSKHIHRHTLMCPRWRL